MRLLRIDRMLTLLGLLGLLLLCLLWWPAAIIYALILQFVCSVLKPERSFDLSDVCAEVSKTMRRIVCFTAAAPLSLGTRPGRKVGIRCLYGNSGTWVPMYHDVACSVIVEESRPSSGFGKRRRDSRAVAPISQQHDSLGHIAATRKADRSPRRNSAICHSARDPSPQPDRIGRVCPRAKSVPP